MAVDQDNKIYFKKLADIKREPPAAYHAPNGYSSLRVGSRMTEACKQPELPSFASCEDILCSIFSTGESLRAGHMKNSPLHADGRQDESAAPWRAQKGRTDGMPIDAHRGCGLAAACTCS